MKFDTVQQVIRIGGYALGGYFLGEGVADSDLFQQALGGAVSVAAFAWWFFWERKRPKPDSANLDG